MTWPWPNRKVDLDCVHLTDSERLDLEIAAASEGLLNGLHKNEKKHIAFCVEDVLKSDFSQLMRITEWQGDLRVKALAWHQWRERNDRWETRNGWSLPLIEPHFIGWQKNETGCGSAGAQIYDTWLSVWELERYFINWISRAHCWTARESVIRPDGASSKPGTFGSFRQCFQQPVLWWESAYGTYCGCQCGKCWFSLSEARFRFDEFYTMLDAARYFESVAIGRRERSAARQLKNKIARFWDFYVRQTPFIMVQTEM